MTPPSASMTPSREAPAWTFSNAARSSTKPAPPAEMHPGLHARCVRVPVRHCAEETRRRLVRDNPAPLRPPSCAGVLTQWAGRLPATTPTMYASQNPRDPSARRKCRSQPQEDRSPASNVHFGRGEGSALLITNPPRAQTREPASCHSTQTALGTPQINSSTFGRIGHPDTHDPAACSRARPGPKSRAADQPPRRTRTHGSPGAHLFSSSQQVREARTRQVARHRIVAGRPRPRAARRRPSAAAGRLSTETHPMARCMEGSSARH